MTIHTRDDKFSHILHRLMVQQAPGQLARRVQESKVSLAPYRAQLCEKPKGQPDSFDFPSKLSPPRLGIRLKVRKKSYHGRGRRPISLPQPPGPDKFLLTLGHSQLVSRAEQPAALPATAVGVLLPDSVNLPTCTIQNLRRCSI